MVRTGRQNFAQRDFRRHTLIDAARLHRASAVHQRNIRAAIYNRRLHRPYLRSSNLWRDMQDTVYHRDMIPARTQGPWVQMLGAVTRQRQARSQHLRPYMRWKRRQDVAQAAYNNRQWRLKRMARLRKVDAAMQRPVRPRPGPRRRIQPTPVVTPGPWYQPGPAPAIFPALPGASYPPGTSLL